MIDSGFCFMVSRIVDSLSIKKSEQRGTVTFLVWISHLLMKAWFSLPKIATRRYTTQVPIQTRPNWSLLPDEIIQLISEKVTIKQQYDNLRLVCKEWRRACLPHPRHLIGQARWLRLPEHPANYALTFYDFSQSKIYKFDPPFIIDLDTPCSRGWFLIEEDMVLSFFNPITRELKRNCLPSLDTTPTILGFARNENTRDHSHFDPDDDHYHYVHISSHIFEVILTSSPSEEGCIVVVRFQHSKWELGFCRVRDNYWTLLKLKDSRHRIDDIKYKNGLLYTTENRGLVIVYDLHDLSRKIIVDELRYADVHDNLYLVIGEGEFDGVPLLVRRASSKEIQVYISSNGNVRSTWRAVNNIGNSVLLLTDQECEMVNINSIELNDWEGNMICVCEVNSDGVLSIEIVRIEDGSITKLPTSFPVFSVDSGFSTSLFTPSRF